VREIRLGTDALSAAGGVAVAADGTLYVIDSLQDQIRVFDRNGTPIATWGERGEGPGQFMFEDRGYYWGDLALGPDGNLYVLDPFNGRVQVLAPDGTFLREFGEPGAGKGQLAAPSGIGNDGDGRVYVTEFGNRRLQIFDSGGQFLAAWAPSAAAGGPFLAPADVAVDSAGTVWVTDARATRIYRLDPEGTVRGVVGESVAGQLRQILSPWGAAVDAAGNLYVAEYGGSRVRVFAPDGTPLGRIGEFGVGPGQFISPIYLTVGPDGLLYVADDDTRRVLVFRLLPPLVGSA
jgi:DNA-binding beta-propeller fold protein YncE